MHTPDEPEPPRRYYDLKPKQGFERQNVSSVVPTDAPTDVRQMFRLANGEAPKPARRNAERNDVHDILDLNLKKEMRAGLYHVEPGVDTKKVARRRKIWMPLLIVNGFAGLVALSCLAANKIGIAEIILIAGCGGVDAVILLHGFFLRTE